MNIYKTIFIIVKHQGDYDEYRAENICGVKTKALADHLKHRYECAFKELYDFYYNRVHGIQETYPEIMDAPESVFNEWLIVSGKMNKFYGARFDIQELQLRRF